MTIWLVLVIVAAAASVAATAMLVLQPFAWGGFFRDPLHATAALQVSGTIFAVMVGFVLLLAFQSYGSARDAAGDEASAAEAQFETAALFPPGARRRLQGELICYGRSVVHAEWASMADGPEPSPEVDRWVGRTRIGFAALRHDAIETAAVQNWLRQDDSREAARVDRLGEAEPIVPTTVWTLLLIAGLAVVGLVLLFADARERRWPQAATVAVVATLASSSLLVVAFLDNTYGDHSGAVQPKAMRESLTTMGRELARDVPGNAVPCDAEGRPTG